MGWPRKGVYFFFESGELRENISDPRVVRVGTHAVSEGSKTTLWDRLRTHRGTVKGRSPGSGNHRGSIFRLHVGTAILNKKERWGEFPTWGRGTPAKPHVRASEYLIEKKVSARAASGSPRKRGRNGESISASENHLAPGRKLKGKHSIPSDWRDCIILSIQPSL